MKQPVLVVMAAGMGSRYGGLKQIDPIDEYGNIIMDFSIYERVQAGFARSYLFTKKKMKKASAQRSETVSQSRSKRHTYFRI